MKIGNGNRDDSFSISLRWMNENIVKDKIKFTMECRQDEMVFLDTNIVATSIADKKSCYHNRYVF